MDKNKQAIAHSFSRAATRYDNFAAVQQRAGRRLLQEMEVVFPQATPKIIADIGCGTGFFIQNLMSHYHPEKLIGVDIAEGMLSVAQHNYQNIPNLVWLCEDIDTSSFADQSVDLVYSNFSFQWTDNLFHLLNTLWRILRPGGLCCFTTLGPKTLVELRESWGMVDNLDHTNQFCSQSQWYKEIERHNFSECSSYQTNDVDYFNSATDVVRSLKAIGANVVKGEHRLSLTGKKRFLRFVDEYEKHRTDKGLPVSYDIQGWLLRKSA